MITLRYTQAIHQKEKPMGKREASLRLNRELNKQPELRKNAETMSIPKAGSVTTQSDASWKGREKQ